MKHIDHKKNLEAQKKLAVQTIYWTNLIWWKILGLIIIGILFYLKIIDFWLALILTLGPTIINRIIVQKKLSKNADEKLIRKWEEAEDAKKEISEIYFSGQRTGEFIIIFNFEINQFTVPEININNTSAKLQSFTKTQAKYHIQAVPNSNTLTVSFGNFACEMINPFYINSLVPSQTRWQTKGHTKEHAVYINPNAFMNPTENTTYSFSIKVNREVFGPFKGLYFKDLGFIKVETGHILANCEQNKCFLIPVWNPDMSIQLPIPEILFSNYVPVFKGKMFPE